MLKADLHSHSTFSDGLLTPTELVTRAHLRGVRYLALTDHDEIDGLDEARQAAAQIAETAPSDAIHIINGIECSTIWRNRTIHIVGLFFDPKNPTLNADVTTIKEGRMTRARLIDRRLAALGIGGALAGTQKFVTNPNLISRSHFARFLEAQGIVSTKQKAFDRFLGQGKSAYVPPPWYPIEHAVNTIHAAGGLAVLAHPGRYKLTPTGKRSLVAHFKDVGGDGIEIISPSHTPDDVRFFTDLARFFELRASLGSDFHGDSETRYDFGGLPDLPGSLVPIWEGRIAS